MCNIVYSNVLLCSTVCVVCCMCDVVARKMYSYNVKMRKFLSGIWQYWISLRALQTASLCNGEFVSKVICTCACFHG